MMVWKLFRILVPYALALAILTVIGLLFARTVGTWMMDRAEAETTATPPGRILTIGDVGVHLLERGAGAPIVLLHDVPGWSGDWPEALLARLEAEHRTIAIDLLGFGFSTRPEEIDMRTWGAQVAAVLGTLGVAPALVVGHGMGAAAALAAAEVDPPAVGRLVLVAPAVPVEDDARSWRSYLPLVPGAGEIMAGWSHALLVPAGAPAAVAAGPWWDVPGTRRTTLAALRDGLPPDALARAMKSARVPALVLHGTRDDVVPWTAARRWVPSIAGVLVKVVDGAGHWLPAERPEEVAGEILRFMEDGR